MQRIGLLLLGMASLVASGVIMDRGHMGVNVVGSLGIQGIRGDDTMTREELMRQKLILDVLHQVHMPLQQHDLLMMDDRSIVTNEDLYMRPLTQEMHMVLNMLRSHEMLGKQSICSLHNNEHLSQMIGLYRLMVTARDFDTLMRLIVHARQNVNTEMFVNCLVLALGERDDTQMLIVPALHEILPQLFHEDRIIDHVLSLDTGVSSVRPQLMDVVGYMRGGMRGMGGVIGMGGLGLHNPLSRIQMQQNGGMWDILNRSQMWMPWREMHKQMALQKMMGRNPMMQNQMGNMNMGNMNMGRMNMGRMNMGNMNMETSDMGNMNLKNMDINKKVISLPGDGLLSQDLSLKSHVNILIDELIVNQDKIKNTNTNQWVRRGVDHDVNDRGIWGNRGQMQMDDLMDDDNDMMMNSQWRRTRDISRDDMMINRDIMQGSRLNIDTKHAMDRNRVMMGGRRRVDNVRDQTEMWNMRRNNNNDDMMSGRRLSNRMVMDNERKMNANWHMGGRNMHQDQPGINTVNINDARLLFVGTRSKNPNRVVTMGRRNNLMNDDDDSTISGGRRVTKEDKNDKNERQRMWQDNDDDIKRMNKNNRRGGMMWNNENDDDDYLMWNMNRRRLNGMNVNSRDSWQNRQIDLDDEDILQRQGMGMTMGRGRDDFLNIVNRNRMGQRQLWGNNEDVMMHHRSLDMDLPTTNIDNERLLYVNRRRLNNVDDGRRVNNRLVDIDEDEDDDDVLQQRRNMGIQRGNRNMDWTRLDEQNNWQRNNMNINNRRVQQQDQREQNWGRLGVDSTNGRRYRRSLLDRNLNMGHDNTVTGKLLLHTLQQLVARLNIERISLGLPQLLEDLQNNQIHHLRTMDSRNDVMTSTTNRRNDLHNVEVDVHTVHKIENIIQRVDRIMQQRITEISHLSHTEKINQIGLMLAGQIEEIGLIELLKEVLQQPLEKGQIANLIDNQAVQMLLAGIVKVVEQQLQQNSPQSQNIISTVHDLKIHNVEVDRLQTHMELTEVDLSNIVQQGQVVGRMPRLNHKTFNIQVDVTSERPQQVIVRHLLVPKVNGQGHLIPLKERLQNVLVLDVNLVELQTGLNTLTLRSHDNTLTSPDTTPLIKIYQQVMQALNGNIMLHKHNLQGQTNMLPHHLLLPRGHVQGLTMQLITVITPIERMNNIMLHQMNGLDILLQDRLPLNYPLHGDITNMESIILMPNVMVKDVKIYHDDQIKMMHLN